MTTRDLSAAGGRPGPARTIRAIPGERRRALATLVATMAHGERLAMEGARLQARLAGSGRVRSFLRRQVWQEAFHAAAFDYASTLLGSGGPGSSRTPPILNRWLEEVKDAVRRGELARSVLLQQVCLEGLGHVFLQRFDRALERAGGHFALLRRSILRQEHEHHVFGAELVDAALRRQGDRDPALSSTFCRAMDWSDELLGQLAGCIETLDGARTDIRREFQAALPGPLRELSP